MRPLYEYDGWVIWATKAGARRLRPRLRARVRGDAYRSLHLDYPLLFPSLEAVDLRTMGSFDGTALHVQLRAAARAASSPRCGAWRGPTLGLVAGACALAVAVSPEVLLQLVD